MLWQHFGRRKCKVGKVGLSMSNYNTGMHTLNIRRERVPSFKNQAQEPRTTNSLKPEDLR